MSAKRSTRLLNVAKNEKYNISISVLYICFFMIYDFVALSSVFSTNIDENANNLHYAKYLICISDC